MLSISAELLLFKSLLCIDLSIKLLCENLCSFSSRFEEIFDFISHLQHNVSFHCSWPVMKQSETDTIQPALTEPELSSVNSVKVLVLCCSDTKHFKIFQQVQEDISS